MVMKIVLAIKDQVGIVRVDFVFTLVHMIQSALSKIVMTTVLSEKLSVLIAIMNDHADNMILIIV